MLSSAVVGTIRSATDEYYLVMFFWIRGQKHHGARTYGMGTVVGDGEAHDLRVEVFHYISIPDTESDVSDSWSGLCRHGDLPVEIDGDHSSTADH